jgi:hypothetical protein
MRRPGRLATYGVLGMGAYDAVATGGACSK